MSLVLDSSALVALLVDSGEDGAWAEATVAGHHLCAPELVYVETLNSLRRLEISRQLTKPEANAAKADLLRLNLEVFPFEPVADRVWELRPGVTSYDAWYVAVAEALEYPLVTLDVRLSKSDGPECRFLTPGK